MYHHSCVGLNKTLPFFACGKQNTSHRSSKTGTNGRNRTFYLSHYVIYRKASRNIATRTVDIKGNLLLAQGVQIQQSVHNVASAIIIDHSPKKDFSFFQ